MAKRIESKRTATRPPRPERVAAFQAGLSAESRAAAFLVGKGYQIVARRFRSPVGEVDIVARRADTLVFVEVKARGTLDGAAESLLPRQQRRIAAAAAAWLATRPEDIESAIRFDAILIAPGEPPRHIEAAFEAQ
jgi:putative endonuclease